MMVLVYVPRPGDLVTCVKILLDVVRWSLCEGTDGHDILLVGVWEGGTGRRSGEAGRGRERYRQIERD